MEGELAKDDAVKAYFDDWGNRCYLLSTEAFGFDYTKDNQPTISSLDINKTVLMEMNCKYIFAAVSIGNYIALGLTYLATYAYDGAAWLIQLYQVF